MSAVACCIRLAKVGESSASRFVCGSMNVISKITAGQKKNHNSSRAMVVPS